MAIYHLVPDLVEEVYKVDVRGNIMKVQCKKITSPLTGEDLGSCGIGLTKNNIYVVLVLDILETGIKRIVIQNDDNGNTGVYDLGLFEIVDSKHSSYWKEFQTTVGITYCPEAWSSDDYWERLDENYYDAIDSFNLYADKMINE